MICSDGVPTVEGLVVAAMSPSPTAPSAVRSLLGGPLQQGSSMLLTFSRRTTLVEQLIPGAATVRLIAGLANKVLNISGIKPEGGART